MATSIQVKNKNIQNTQHLIQNFDVTRFLSLLYTGGKVCVSNNEKFFVSCADKIANIVDYESGEVLAELVADETIITIAISPNDKLLAVSTRNGSVQLFSISQARLINTFSAASSMTAKIPATQLSFNQSGTILAVALGNSSIRLYSIKEHKFLNQLHNNISKSSSSSTQVHTGKISLLQFFTIEPFSNYLVSSALDGVKIWNIESKKGEQCIAWVNKDLGDVNTVAFSAEHKWMITGGDEILKVYDIEQDFKDIRTIHIGKIVAGIVLTSNNQLALVSPESSDISVWNIETGEKEKTSTESVDNAMSDDEEEEEEEEHENGEAEQNGTSSKPGFFKLFQIHYSPIRKSFMCVTTDQNFLFYTWPELKRDRQIAGFNDEILDLTLLMNKTKSGTAEENRELIIATNSEKIMRVNLKSKSVQFMFGHRDLALGVAVDSVHEKFAVSCSKDRTARVWDLATNRCVAVGTAHSKSVTSVAFSNTSKRAFFVSASDDKTVKVWDLSVLTQEKLKQLRGKNYSDKDVVPIRPEHSVDAHTKEIHQIALSPNDEFLATASSDKTVKIWRVETMELVRTIQHPKAVFSVAFSPVDKTIITGCGDSVVRIHSLTTGSILKIFSHDTSHSILKVAFIRNGTQIVSIDAAGLLKLWSIKASTCLGMFDEHADRVWGLSIFDKLNDQFFMVTGGEDSRVNIWKDNTLDVVQEQKREVDESVKMEQELKNLVKNKKHLTAIKLAIKADRPRQVFTLIDQFLALSKESKGESETIADLIGSLEYTEVMTLFQYTIDWNTNSRFSSVAQRVLHAMFNNLEPSFINTPYEKSVTALVAYSEKHSKRVQTLLQRSYLLDYVLSNMKMVAPQAELEINLETLLANNASQSISTSGDKKRKRVQDPELELPDEPVKTKETEAEPVKQPAKENKKKSSEKPKTEEPPAKKQKLENDKAQHLESKKVHFAKTPQKQNKSKPVQRKQQQMKKKK